MRKARQRIGMLVAGLLLCIAWTMPSHADDQSDHDRARQALEAGEILPLKAVLEKVGRDTPGQVMEVELERKHERWVYEIKMLRPGGSLVRLWVDASDGTILGRQGRGARPER